VTLTGLVPLLTVLAAIGGLLISGWSAWESFSASRANRFADRAKGLWELHELLLERGELIHATASKNAANSHRSFLVDLELEGRRNAAMYLHSLVRLARPGSALVGVTLIFYGLILGVAGVSPVVRSASGGALTWDQTVSGGVLLMIAAVVFAIGWSHLRRRLGARRVRKQIGEIDELTLEGVEWIRQLPSVLLERRRQRTRSDLDVDGI